MASIISIVSAITRRHPEDEPVEIVGALAGFGNIFGIIAAVIGVFAGISFVPMSAIPWEVTSDTPFQWTIAGSSLYPTLTAVFMGLLAVGLFLQAIGSKDLRAQLGSIFGSVLYIAFIMAALIAGYVIIGFNSVRYTALAIEFMSIIYLLGAVFVISWQMVSIFYIDSSKSWYGFLAGLTNGMFLPMLALGQALTPILISLAYITLLIGQLASIVFWWSPNSTIREFARSPKRAKFAFGVSGLLTFLIGFAAVFYGPVEYNLTGGVIWRPWSTTASSIAYVTNPSLVYAFIISLMFWILLSPRLGAKELKTSAIGEDIIKGGSKWFAVFLLMVGVIAAGQAGTFAARAIGWGLFMVIPPAGAMLLIGALYAAKTDIITGVPLILAAILIMISPFSLAILVISAWIAVIITQAFLMIESYIRGLTGFSQGALTVLVSLLSSIAIIIIMLGGLGSGPVALWPTNRWFNITLIPGISPALQSSVIIILPILLLVLRNSALAGYSYGRGYTTGGILMGMSILFALLIPMIAGNVTVTHEANTGAALMLALYSISVVLVMTLNLSLANDVEDSGHAFEGTFIKISSIIQVLFAAGVAVMVLIYFSQLPSADDIALVISVFVTFVVGAEILSVIGWLLAGIRLGLLKQGFRFQRIET
ncbi:MAG: hypothetical protein BV458_09215 [Thermoplasmata archaeon M9B2D]|nr:MAG: hypothetical protein BV458_09215 [Thermoplasmata archaeon M9B2D]